MTAVISTPEGIHFAQLLALRGAVKLELRGMKRRGRSASVIAKEMFGMSRGARKQKVLDRLDEEINKIKEARRQEQEGSVVSA